MNAAESKSTPKPAGAVVNPAGYRSAPRRASGEGESPSRLLAAIFSRFATVVVLLVLVVGFSLLSDQFLTQRNWQNLLVVQSVVSCVSFAALVPLTVGEFDLSLGNMIGFLTMVGAYMGGQGFGAPAIMSVMLLGGVIVGTINGCLTVKLHISSFIATLGTGIILSGFTLGISGGQVLFDGIPPFMLAIGQGMFLKLGPTVWLTIIVGLILYVVLEHTPIGRKLYAIGGSERVAFLAGVPTDLLKILAFSAAGLLIGVGSIFALGQSGAGNSGFGPELLLPAYATCFLSVTIYRPGFFNVVGIGIAIVLLAVGFNGLSLLGAPFWSQPIFNGAVLIVAVITARAESRHIKK